MIETFNGKGEYEFTPETSVSVTIATTASFNVIVDDSIIGPVSSTDRRFKLTVYADQHFTLLTTDRYTITMDVLPNRNEINSGDKLVEVIDDSELSMEDRLRSQMMAQLSILAEKQNLDSYDDDDDFDDDFDEDPLSSYEKKEMAEEYLLDNDLHVGPNGELQKNSAPQISKENSDSLLEVAETSEAN